jgi:hypothetical protein
LERGVLIDDLSTWGNDHERSAGFLIGPAINIAGTVVHLYAAQVDVAEDGAMKLSEGPNESTLGDLLVLRGFERQIDCAMESVECGGKRWVIWASPTPAMTPTENLLVNAWSRS